MKSTSDTGLSRRGALPDAMRVLVAGLGILLAACSGGATEQQGTQTTQAVGTTDSEADQTATSRGHAGSESCRDCHESFYQLWAHSHHGTAMQPFTAELGRSKLKPMDEALAAGSGKYRVAIDDDGGRLIELGEEGESSYPMLYALGGKNVFYFLTPLERGRLQVLPLAYDINEKEWFDTAASAMRHFTDDQLIAQVQAILAEDQEEKVFVFACNWCSYAGGDMAGISRLEYPASNRVIRTMCSARVPEEMLLEAFRAGDR